METDTSVWGKHQAQADSPNLPRGSWVPFPRNPIFTGREDEQLSLVQYLLFTEEESQNSPRLAIISGPTGVGKTQLAAAFCYRHRQSFEGVHWINCRDTGTQYAQVAQHGQVMDLPNWPQKVPAQAEATLRAWRTARRLIVLDHLDAANGLPEWLEQLENVRVLITTREGFWPTELGSQILPLEVLPSPTSIALMQAVSPRLRKAKESEIEQIAAQLGDLPMALQLAGHYLEDRVWTSPKGYLTELEKAVENLNPALADWSQDSLLPGAPYLAAAFELTLRLLDEPAQRIFFTMAHFASDIPISRDLPYCTTGITDPDQVIHTRSLERLTRLGLLIYTPEGPITQALLTELALLVEPEKAATLARLAGAVASSEFAKNAKATLRSLLALNAHQETMLAHAEQAGLSQSGAAWYHQGELHWRLGAYGKAQYYLEKALALDELTPALSYARIANEHHILGHVLHEMDDLKGALACYQKALTAAGQLYSPDHPEMAAYHNSLGTVLSEMGNFKRAKTCFEQALAIHEKGRGFGPKHPEVANDCSSLGRVLENLNDLQGARACYERALSINESVFVYGPDHPLVARDLTNLGRVLRALGDLNSARPCFERALKIDEKHYGLEHAETAAALNYLGRTLRDLGKQTEAKACFERVLSVDEKVYGVESTKTAADLHNLGLTMRALGDLSGSKDCFERAMKIEEHVHWPEHPNVATNANNLGRVLQDMGDLHGSKTCFERALAIDQEIYGEKHPYVATDINNLGSVLQDLKKLPDARRCFEQALSIDETAYGLYHASVARDLNNLGSVSKAQGDLQEAKAHFERALQIFESLYGLDHPKTRVVRDNLNGVLWRIQRS